MPAARLSLVGHGRLLQAEDSELARALIRGDAGATLAAWHRFSPVVLGTLRRLLGPGGDLDDLCQEVFIRFFRRVPDLREPGLVRGFLFAISVRMVRKEIKRRWLRRWLRLTDDGRTSDVQTTSDDSEAREAVARYYDILGKIGGADRSLFVLRTIEQRELKEVAHLHGLSVSTAQRKLARVSKRVSAMVMRDPVLRDYLSSREADQ